MHESIEVGVREFLRPAGPSQPGPAQVITHAALPDPHALRDDPLTVPGDT